MTTGAVELAAVGISIALFNQVSRIAIFPLVSVTTSFVAEEDTMSQLSQEAREGESLQMGTFVSTEGDNLIPTEGMSGYHYLLVYFRYLDIIFTTSLSELSRKKKISVN